MDGYKSTEASIAARSSSSPSHNPNHGNIESSDDEGFDDKATLLDRNRNKVVLRMQELKGKMTSNYVTEGKGEYSSDESDSAATEADERGDGDDEANVESRGAKILTVTAATRECPKKWTGIAKLERKQAERVPWKNVR